MWRTRLQWWACWIALLVRWSLLKRVLNGTYVAVEPFHLFRYVDEQVFRYNNRATKDNPLNDSDRFVLALSQVAGKRLTYSEVTGKIGTTPAQPSREAWPETEERLGFGPRFGCPALARLSASMRSFNSAFETRSMRPSASLNVAYSSLPLLVVRIFHDPHRHLSSA
jgi:hypothetical protein